MTNKHDMISNMDDPELLQLMAEARTLEAAVTERKAKFEADDAAFMAARDAEMSLRAAQVETAQRALNEAVARARQGGKNVDAEQAALVHARRLRDESTQYGFVPPLTPLQTGALAPRWLDPKQMIGAMAAQEWALKEALARVALRRFALANGPARDATQSAIAALREINFQADAYSLFTADSLMGVNLLLEPV